MAAFAAARSGARRSARRPASWASGRGVRLISGIGTPGAQVAIERKWQARWEEEGLGPARPAEVPAGERFYCLPMFPYPSGSLHAGHLRVYTISDCVARFQRMRGREVLHPIGWDSFGLPAENAARDRGVDPAAWTESNTASMREALKGLGASFDWSRELSTSRPEYYRWTQDLFRRMHGARLAYQAEAEVWWDPVDRTVLANEQVGPDGSSWRSGAPAQRRVLTQWFLRTTALAEHLLAELDEADRWDEALRRRYKERRDRARRAVLEANPEAAESSNTLAALIEAALRAEPEEGGEDAAPAMAGWPAAVRSMQRQWIGATRAGVIEAEAAVGGETVRVRVSASAAGPGPAGRALVIGPSHPLLLAATRAGLRADGIDDLRRAGAAGRSASLVVPLRVDVNGQSVPVVVSTSAPTLRIPGAKPLDDTELGRAVCMAELPALVVLPEEAEEEAAGWAEAGPCLGNGAEDDERRASLVLRTLRAAGVPPAAPDAAPAPAGPPVTLVAMRDWLVSRQRHWGTPVPVVHCRDCGPVPVPADQLPVELPPAAELAPEAGPGSGASSSSPPSSVDAPSSGPLSRAPASWLDCPCPACGGPGRRDTDTLDTFVDSSWYMHRYPDPACLAAPCSPAAAAAWSPVDLYVGGVEHATTHLLFARFFHAVMAADGLLGPAAAAAGPVRRLLTQGMVLGEVWYDEQTGRIEPDAGARAAAAALGGTSYRSQWEKMSKSKGNGVDAGLLLATEGADVARLQVLFLAPPHKDIRWSNDRLTGVRRWLGRLDQAADAVVSAKQAGDGRGGGDGDAELAAATATAVAAATDALTRSLSFNVAVAELMGLTNELERLAGDCSPAAADSALRTLVRMLAPMAPHAASDLWERVAPGEGDVHAQEWPQ